ncbi:MAG: MoaD/ThiS family protein [Planctomycetota bacterium]|nr:MAG: MoaD/ThiS family protein [Planctomycetota bacterium]
MPLQESVLRSVAMGSVTVSLFAGMAELAGSRRLEIPWAGGTVGALRSALKVACPAVGPLLARSAVAVAGRYAADDSAVVAGDDVAVIPPVSGG